MRYQSFEVTLFEFGVNTDGGAYINILGIETVEWMGALLHCGRDIDGRWEIDVAYTRSALFYIQDWWSGRE